MLDGAGSVWTVLETRGVAGDLMLGDTEVHRQAIADGGEVPCTQATQAVLPRPDGSYLVVHRYLDKPRRIVYRHDGKQARLFCFGDGTHRSHRLRQLRQSANGTRGWMLVDREYDGTKRERVLYRLDVAVPAQPPDPRLGAAVDPGVPLVARDGATGKAEFTAPRSPLRKRPPGDGRPPPVPRREHRRRPALLV